MWYTLARVKEENMHPVVPRVEYTCALCGKQFKRLASQMIYTKHLPFCSRLCSLSKEARQMVRPRMVIDPSPNSKKIYSLSDPRDGRVRYIGASRNLYCRI